MTDIARPVCQFALSTRAINERPKCVHGICYEDTVRPWHAFPGFVPEKGGKVSSSLCDKDLSALTQKRFNAFITTVVSCF